MKNKKYTVVLLPEDGDESRSFSISRKGFRNSVILVGFILLAIIGFTLMYLPKALDYDRLEEEHQTLMEERLKVAGLLNDLNRIHQMEDYIRQSLGADLEFPLNPMYSDSALENRRMAQEERSHISFLDNIPSHVPATGFITQDFSGGYNYKGDEHPGIDIAAPKGEAVQAAASGLVVFSGWTYHYGNLVVIYHGDDYFSFYGHNERNLVAPRQVVDRGEAIAMVGESGIGTGPHLHFEIWKDGRPVDPKLFINEDQLLPPSLSNHGER